MSDSDNEGIDKEDFSETLSEEENGAKKDLETSLPSSREVPEKVAVMDEQMVEASQLSETSQGYFSYIPEKCVIM